MRFEQDSFDNSAIREELSLFVPLCVSENTNDLLLIGYDDESGRLGKLAKNISNVNELASKGSFESETFDIIVSKNSEINLQEAFRILKKDGILSVYTGKDIAKQLKELGDFYRIVMPFCELGVIFASNKYHPTADLILDRSDFIETAEYYNSDIHIATFALYEKTKKMLKGLLKN